MTFEPQVSHSGNLHPHERDRARHINKNARQKPGIFNLHLTQGLFPVGNGHAACGLRDVFAGGAEAVAVALFFATGFLAAFFAATFFAGAFFAAAFFTVVFFADAFFVAGLLAAFFGNELLVAPFFAGAFLLAAFFMSGFVTPTFFAATFLVEDFGAVDFFFTGIFFAEAFFAVAISFLLDQGYKNLHVFGYSPRLSRNSSPKVCPSGTLRYDEFVSRSSFSGG